MHRKKPQGKSTHRRESLTAEGLRVLLRQLPFQRPGGGEGELKLTGKQRSGAELPGCRSPIFMDNVNEFPGVPQAEGLPPSPPSAPIAPLSTLGVSPSPTFRDCPSWSRSAGTPKLRPPRLLSRCLPTSLGCSFSPLQAFLLLKCLPPHQTPRSPPALPHPAAHLAPPRALRPASLPVSSAVPVPAAHRIRRKMLSRSFFISTSVLVWWRKRSFICCMRMLERLLKLSSISLVFSNRSNLPGAGGSRASSTRLPGGSPVLGRGPHGPVPPGLTCFFGPG